MNRILIFKNLFSFKINTFCRFGFLIQIFYFHIDSDSESSSSEEENLYYSTYDNKLKKGIGNTKPLPENRESETHNFCLTLKVGKGLMTIYAPVRVSNISSPTVFRKEVSMYLLPYTIFLFGPT